MSHDCPFCGSDNCRPPGSCKRITPGATAGSEIESLIHEVKEARNRWIEAVDDLSAAALHLESAVNPGPDPEPDPDKPDDDGDDRLLWKPVSDSTQKAVCLTPANLNSTLVSVSLHGETAGERSTIENGEYKNGNRRHWWFDKPGRSYPPGNIYLTLKDGTQRIFSLPNPGVRYEQKLTELPTPEPEPEPNPKQSNVWLFEDGRSAANLGACPIKNPIVTTVNGVPRPGSRTMRIVQPVGRMGPPFRWDSKKPDTYNYWKGLKESTRIDYIRGWARAQFAQYPGLFGLGIDAESFYMPYAEEFDSVLSAECHAQNKPYAIFPKSDLEHYKRHRGWSYHETVDYIDETGIDYVVMWNYGVGVDYWEGQIEKWLDCDCKARLVVMPDGMTNAVRNQEPYATEAEELAIARMVHGYREYVDLGWFYLLRDGWPNKRADITAQLYAGTEPETEPEPEPHTGAHWHATSQTFTLPSSLGEPQWAVYCAYQTRERRLLDSTFANYNNGDAKNKGTMLISRRGDGRWELLPDRFTSVGALTVAVRANWRHYVYDIARANQDQGDSALKPEIIG